MKFESLGPWMWEIIVKYSNRCQSIIVNDGLLWYSDEHPPTPLRKTWFEEGWELSNDRKTESFTLN